MNALLENTIGLEGLDAATIVIGVLLLFSIAAVIMGLRYLFEPKPDVVEQRLRRFVADTSSSYPPATSGAASVAPKRFILDTAIKPFATVATPTNEEELRRLQNKLSYAGFRGDRALTYYLGARVGLGLFFAIVVLSINSVRSQPLAYDAFFLVSAISIGFYLPTVWLHRLVKSRQRSINHALPDTLDLLVTCVDSGLGLDAAMNRVAEEIAISFPLLSQELNQAAFEIRAGATRGDAFRRLAARTGVEDIRNLSSVIVQTEIFGTSMAKALRVMADGMRVRRMQSAEEKAATVAVKMTIPLVLCILPSLFTILMGPAAIKIIRMLIPTLGGGHL